MYRLNSELFCEFPSQERIQQGCHSWYEKADGNYLECPDYLRGCGVGDGLDYVD